MDFRIADTFTDSLTHLTGEEQKSVKTTAFDLQVNPSSPGMSFHKLDRAKDANFWSVRVSRDIRLIVHRTASSLLLCYVDHHDQAYRWAERRKLETHPNTGAAQLVEIRERVEEIAIPPKYVEVELELPARRAVIKPSLFANLPEDELLGYGVPAEWLADVRTVNEDTLLDLADHLPAEAAEALLELATGGTPQRSPNVAESSPFDHPDAQRRFRVMADVDELEQALAYPWEKWTIFLHPAQREWVERSYSGPARVSGSAGTGKTIVALHRAVYLARSNPQARVLLSTFSDTLAKAMHTKLRRLISNDPKLAERIDVSSMNAVGERLYESHFGRAKIVGASELRSILESIVLTHPPQRLSLSFLLAEWDEVVDAWQLDSWESYRDVKRLGRKTGLPEAQRLALWQLFVQLRAELSRRGLQTPSEIVGRLTRHLGSRKHIPYDFAVVDEAQDASVAQIRLLAAIGGDRPDALFFAGDLGQRIFQQPFSWKSLGVELRGRARTLHINYRTSHQIRMQADRLLAPEVSDVDGNSEERRGTISVFNGPQPVVRAFDDSESESKAVGDWLAERVRDGMAAHEVAVFVRSTGELDRARAAAIAAGIPLKVLDDKEDTTTGHISICSMHLAKGLEFRAVAVMACDDEVIPSQHRIESVSDDSELEEVYNTERHLLYVACTRARDFLWVSGVAPVSEFLDDLKE